jgi:hypothetical protein
MTKAKYKPPDKSGGDPPFVTEYVHYRTKKLMRAVDYGYRAWPFGAKAR